MKITTSSLLNQIVFGAVGAAMGAVLGWVVMATYGGNFGCFELIDVIFDLRGYESCGAFGGWVGFFLGSLVGVFLISRLSKKDPTALSRFTNFFLPLWLIAIPLTFGFIYLKNAQEHAKSMADLESKVEKRMIESNLIDFNIPIEIADLNQSPEKLEVLFTQGEYELTVRLITGASAEKWVLDAESGEPPSENANVISYFYSNEWSPHVGLSTHFDYKKSYTLSGPEAANKNIFVAIEGLKILEKDSRLLDSFKSQVEDLKSSLMVMVRDDLLREPKAENVEGFVSTSQ